MNGDGCDSNCKVESGFVCTGGSAFTPDSCTRGALLGTENFESSAWTVDPTKVGSGGAIEASTTHAFEVSSPLFRDKPLAVP